MLIAEKDQTDSTAIVNTRDEPRKHQWSVSQAASQPAEHACREEINYHEISCNSCEW
jgi:hypothetical protein